MPALRDPQHEKFSIEFVELAFSGNRNPLIEAYKSAGYAAHRGNAARLRRRPEVDARIQELIAEAAEFANVRAKRIIVEVDRVGRANFADFWEPETKVVKREDGTEHVELTGRVRLKPLDQLPRELTAAIQSLEYDEVGRPKLKLFDKNQANFTLLKHLGGLPDDQRGGTTVNILNVVPIEDQAAIADLIEAYAAGEERAGSAIPGERREAAAVP
jgi:hypothetical protein